MYNLIHKGGSLSLDRTSPDIELVRNVPQMGHICKLYKTVHCNLWLSHHWNSYTLFINSIFCIKIHIYTYIDIMCSDSIFYQRFVFLVSFRIWYAIPDEEDCYHLIIKQNDAFLKLIIVLNYVCSWLKYVCVFSLRTYQFQKNRL